MEACFVFVLQILQLYFQKSSQYCRLRPLHSICLYVCTAFVTIKRMGRYHTHTIVIEMLYVSQEGGGRRSERVTGVRYPANWPALQLTAYYVFLFIHMYIQMAVGSLFEVLKHCFIATNYGALTHN